MTERIQWELIQGSDDWHQFRLQHDGSSEVPAMLGLDDNVRRNELLHAKHTGIAKEFSDFVQTRILNHGHEVEALARPIAEKIIGEELYPSVWSYGRLSDSCDGLTVEGSTGWQCKQWNAKLAAAVASGVLPDKQMAQVQQEIYVTGATRWLFMVTDGTEENCETMWITPNAKWIERIKAGWAMFHQDLDHYTPPEVIPSATATPTMALPALSIQVNGSISLTDNLAIFGEKLTAFIERIPAKPSSDQDFADCEAAVKVLVTAQDALEAAESSALAQVATVDEMRRTVAMYVEQARTTRLMLTKLVSARKEQIRVEIVQAGKNAIRDHVETLNKRLGKSYMPSCLTTDNLAGVIKGMKTVSSIRNAVDTEVARVKIELSAVADRIQINLATLKELTGGVYHLFPDTAQIILKASDDFIALVKTRIADHVKAEAERIEKERERIRQEEQIKAEAAARAKVEAEQKAAAQIAHQAGQQQAVLPPAGVAAPSKMVTTNTVIAAPPSKDGYGIVGAIPPSDREGLIRSFLDSLNLSRTQRGKLYVELVKFCEFCDKFKVKS